MSNVTEPQWIKWAWRYGHLQAEGFDTLELAFDAAFVAQDDEALECFEGPDGRVVSKDAYREYERERFDRDREREAAQPKLTAGVQIQGPDGKHWAWWWGGGFVERADAEAEADRLRARFGDRIKVVGIPLTM